MFDRIDPCARRPFDPARSMRMGGVVMGKASQAVIDKATRIAGHVLEADTTDIAFAEGELLDARGHTCATAKGIWRIFWPRDAAPGQP